MSYQEQLAWLGQLHIENLPAQTKGQTQSVLASQLKLSPSQQPAVS